MSWIKSSRYFFITWPLFFLCIFCLKGLYILCENKKKCDRIAQKQKPLHYGNLLCLYCCANFSHLCDYTLYLFIHRRNNLLKETHHYQRSNNNKHYLTCNNNMTRGQSQHLMPVKKPKWMFHVTHQHKRSEWTTKQETEHTNLREIIPASMTRLSKCYCLLLWF